MSTTGSRPAGLEGLTLNALSIDVEEYYHGMEFEAAVPASERRHLPSRVRMSTERVLEILGERGVRATFFVVGTVAEQHPGLVRAIVRDGHEVACHSYSHQLVSRQTPDEFRTDLHRAKGILEDLTGAPVIGFRAPNYSIGPDQQWAYDTLLDAGFRYDSSIYPIRHDRYGDPAAPRFPYVIRERGADRLVEFPIATSRVWGMNLPIGGGGFFRLLPVRWIGGGILGVNGAEGQAVMFYFHPWEMDPGQPRPPMPWLHRFRHYVNLDRFEGKLEALLEQVRFGPAREVLGFS